MLLNKKTKQNKLFYYLNWKLLNNILKAFKTKAHWKISKTKLFI